MNKCKNIANLNVLFQKWGQGHILDHDLDLREVMTLTLVLLRVIFSCHRYCECEKLPKIQPFLPVLWKWGQDQGHDGFFFEQANLSHGHPEYVNFCFMSIYSVVVEKFCGMLLSKSETKTYLSPWPWNYLRVTYMS